MHHAEYMPPSSDSDSECESDDATFPLTDFQNAWFKAKEPATEEVKAPLPKPPAKPIKEPKKQK
jgi:hypothetical protein